MANISYSPPSIWDWNVARPRTRDLAREYESAVELRTYITQILSFGYTWEPEPFSPQDIDAMSELSDLQSVYQELHVRYLSLLPSYANPQVPPMIDHVRSLLERAAARIGLLTSEEARWRQDQRLRRAEAERLAQAQIQIVRAERERAYQEQERVRRVATEARRAAGRALYQSRTQSLRARVAAGRPYYEKMAYELAARRPFLDALRAAPDDDSTRLIYCDWLEEQGDADAALFLRDNPLSLSLWSAGIGFPPRTGGYVRSGFARPATLANLMTFSPGQLYNGISNFGWVAVAETQETLEAIGLSLTPSAAATMTMITPAYIRPMLARLYQNAKKEK